MTKQAGKEEWAALLLALLSSCEINLNRLALNISILEKIIAHSEGRDENKNG